MEMQLSEFRNRYCQVITVCFLVSGFIHNLQAGQQEVKKQPNILIFLADDMGYSDLGCFGGEIQTPNLNQLAENGLRFTQFYNTARCWPTRGALLTGYYAQQIRRDAVPGLPSGGQGKRPAWAPLLPALLKNSGYRSYHSGKWHIDSRPLAEGFDRSYRLEDAGRFFSPRVHFEDDKPLPAAERGSGYYSTTEIATRMISYLKEHSEKHADRPFFAYTAFLSPHFPLQALQEDIEKYQNTYKNGWDTARAARHERQFAMGFANQPLPAVERGIGAPYSFPKAIEQFGSGEVPFPRPWTELTEEQKEFQATKMAIHAAMVDRMDQEIGRVVDQLRAMNQLENTLILFLSDNGASAELMIRDDGHDPKAAPGSADTHLCLGPGFSMVANTPFRRHKTWVHEGGISTSMIAHWPAGISARGELRTTPGHVVDVVPTVLDLAGVKKPQEIMGAAVPESPGVSLKPALIGNQSVSRDSIWWLHEGNRALRVGDWKIVMAKDETWQLYDLSKDRGEINDLSGKMPEKVRQMQTQWERQFEEISSLAKRDLKPEDLRKAADAVKKKAARKKN
ncbi:MAG: Arylsulfatase [Planctomycetota bacterium]